MAWYAAHTHSHAEAQARWHIERQGFKTYLPQYLKKRRHARKTDWVQAPLFPRYLFVWLDTARQRWQSIQSTVGVRYLICGDKGPLEVPAAIVEELRQRENDQGLIDLGSQLAFNRGDKVQVTDGALLDQIGIFQCASGDQRAIVLLKLLGRDLKVTLPQAALCRA